MCTSADSLGVYSGKTHTKRYKAMCSGPNTMDQRVGGVSMLVETHNGSEKADGGHRGPLKEK